MRRERDRMRKALQRAVEQGRTRVEPRKAHPMLDGLRNAQRTATGALDVAGVPDALQGMTPTEAEEAADGRDDWEDFA